MTVNANIARIPVADFSIKGSTLSIHSKVEGAATLVIQDAKGPFLTKFGHITTIETSDPSKIKDVLEKYTAERTEKSLDDVPLKVGAAVSIPLAALGMGAVLLAAHLIGPFLVLSTFTATVLATLLAVVVLTVAMIAVPCMIMIVLMGIALNVAFTKDDVRNVEKQREKDFFARVTGNSTEGSKDDLDFSESLIDKLTAALQLQKDFDNNINTEGSFTSSEPSVVNVTI